MAKKKAAKKKAVKKKAVKKKAVKKKAVKKKKVVKKKKAAKFQKFWGEKAELRRFKDGSILESLIWPAGSAHTIFREIVTYLINRHLGQDSSASLEFIGEGFDKILPASSSSMKHGPEIGNHGNIT